MPTKRQFETHFPNLRAEGYKVTSDSDLRYNCIAWAAGDETRWWWPDAMDSYFWPLDASRDESIEAFVRAFGSLGYGPCPNGDLEPGVEKVAIYSSPNGKPTHAARQLTDGQWTSKLGCEEDIGHTLDGLESPVYGSVVRFLKRPKP